MTQEEGQPTDPALRDPFWRPVRERDPDLDIVLLPPEPERLSTDVDVRPEPERLETLPPQVEAWAAGLWRGLALPDPEVQARWTSGASAESVVRELLAAVEPVSGPDAASALDQAEQWLRRAGYHVFRPPTGLPRLNASYVLDHGPQDVLLVHVPATGRVALQVRQPAVVGAQAAAEAVGSP